MKNFLASLILSTVAATSAFSAVNTYQVTGSVVSKTDRSIVVEKGKEKWEIALDGGVKVPDSVKVGDKVTVEYRMTAVSVEAKAAKSAKLEKGAKGKAKARR